MKIGFTGLGIMVTNPNHNCLLALGNFY